MEVFDLVAEIQIEAGSREEAEERVLKILEGHEVNALVRGEGEVLNSDNIVPGTIFVGNVNGAKMEIVKIEGDSVVIKDWHTGRKFIYGIKALEKCDVTLPGLKKGEGENEDHQQAKPAASLRRDG